VVGNRRGAAAFSRRSADGRGASLTTNDVVAGDRRRCCSTPAHWRSGRWPVATPVSRHAWRAAGQLSSHVAKRSPAALQSRPGVLAGPACAWCRAVVRRGRFRHLAAAGSWPRWPRDGRCQLQPGDEISGRRPRPAGGRVRTVRNLARGSQELHRHDLDARWAAVLRAGGLIRHVSTVELAPK
jgi:hypothetical protein